MSASLHFHERIANQQLVLDEGYRFPINQWFDPTRNHFADPGDSE